MSLVVDIVNHSYHVNDVVVDENLNSFILCDFDRVSRAIELLLITDINYP